MQEAIDKDWKTWTAEGAEVLMTGIDTPRNAVVVEVKAEALTSRGADALRQQYGQGVALQEGTRPTVDACNSTYDCRPMKGGLAIYRRSTIYPCTSGFVVKPSNSSSVQLLTAGHCIDIGAVDEIWDHNPPSQPNDSFGRSQFETWDINTTRDADVGLVSIFAAEQPITKNLIHTGAGRLNAVTYSVPNIYQTSGHQICRYGEHQNLPGKLECGTITVVNATTNPSKVDGVGTMTVRHTWEVSFDSIGGDSGGPMFAYLTGGPFGTGSVAAYGTHVHSDPDNQAGANGWYSTIDWGKATYPTFSGGISYSVCINGSCT